MYKFVDNLLPRNCQRVAKSARAGFGFGLVLSVDVAWGRRDNTQLILRASDYGSRVAVNEF